MLLGTHTAQLSQVSLRTPRSAFGNHQQQVLTALSLCQEVCSAHHTHVPFNPLGGPRADTLIILILPIMKGNTRD